MHAASTCIATRALAKRVVHIGSTSATLAAEMSDCNLSAWRSRDISRMSGRPVAGFDSVGGFAVGGSALTVTSTPSSARMRAAYEAASSAVDILGDIETVLYRASLIGEQVAAMPSCNNFYVRRIMFLPLGVMPVSTTDYLHTPSCNE